MRISLWVWHERAKGEASFWKPYFDIINFTDLPMLWNDSELLQFQDAVLIDNIRGYKKDFDLEWELMYDVLFTSKSENIIPGICEKSKKEQLKKDFTWAFCSAVTRCFGWGLPCTMMIPFADTINHHNVDSSYDIIKAEWRTLPLDGLYRRYPEKFGIKGTTDTTENSS